MKKNTILTTIKIISKYTIPLSIMLASSIALGIFCGMKIQQIKSANKKNFLSTPIENSKQKFVEIAQNIEKIYINEVDISKFANLIFKDVLEKIDPYSSYQEGKNTSTKNNQSDTDNDNNIGATVITTKGITQIVSPIYGSASEEAGLKPGDIILKIDDEEISNKGLTERDIIAKLSGPKDSKVSLTIKRKGEDTPQQFFVVRRKTPSTHVSGCMLNSDTGYIKISYFSPNSSKEFFVHLNHLLKNGAQSLVIDLRGNPGGDLEEAVDIGEKFIPKGQLIYYTMYKSEAYNKRIYSTSKNNYENLKLLILVDSGTAGASEILAGVLQDYDKALLVGERTFGRGILQQVITLQDSSQIFITVARYCTPSGRSIQKSYSAPSIDDTNPIIEQYKKIGYFRSDMMQTDDKLRYRTAMGRIIVGGGGIVPDFIILPDSEYKPTFLNKIKAIIKQIAFEYYHQNYKSMNKMKFEKFIKSFEIPDIVINQLRTHIEKEHLECSDTTFNAILPNIKIQLKAYIAHNIWGDPAYYTTISTVDDVLLKGLEILKETNILVPETPTTPTE